jgi:hypothetical protein
MVASEEDDRDKLQTIKGGSSETELKELAVKPTAGAGGLVTAVASFVAVVITVTPVAKRPSAERKKAESKLGLVAVIIFKGQDDR